MPCRTLLVTNGRRMAARSSAGMPGPVSLTITCPTPAPSRDVDRHVAADGRRVERVRDQVGDDLQDAIAVAEHDGPRGDAHLQIDAARAGLLALGAGGALAQGDDVDLLDVERELARLETGEVEQVADQPLQAAGLREHDLERRLALVLAVDHAVGDRLDVALDGGQRRAQLVRDAHQEVALVLARLLELARHLLEAVRELAELVRALGAQVHVVVAQRDALAGLGQLAHRARDAPAEQQSDERRGRQGQQQRRHEAAPLHERRGVDRAHGRATTIAPISGLP